MLHSSRFRPCFSLRATLPAINSTRLGWQTFVSSLLVPPDKLLTSGNYHAILLHGRQSLSSSHFERLFWAFGPLRTNTACANPFRISTYKNGAVISFRISTYEKRRGGGGAGSALRDIVRRSPSQLNQLQVVIFRRPLLPRKHRQASPTLAKSVRLSVHASRLSGHLFVTQETFPHDSTS